MILAGRNVLVTADVMPVLVTQSPDELARKFLTGFAACVMTWSRYKKDQEDVDQQFLWL